MKKYVFFIDKRRGSRGRACSGHARMSAVIEGSPRVAAGSAAGAGRRASPAVLIPFILFFLFLQTGCSNKSEIPQNAKQGYKKPVSIYLLSAASDPSFYRDLQAADKEEWFYSVKDFSIITAREKPLVPWPRAVRISDIVETENGTIVILINKKGVAAFQEIGAFQGAGAFQGTAAVQKAADFQGDGFLSAKITDESFSNYTSGKIITNNNSILCHVYADTFFDENFSAPLSPFVEIDIDKKKSTYTKHNYPVSTNDYSLINLKKINDKWFSAWKKSNAKETLFKYFVHSSHLGENAGEIAESKFMLADQFLNNSNLPDTLKKFISNITKPEISNNSIIEVEIRSKDNQVVTTYLMGTAGSDSSHYEKMCVSPERAEALAGSAGRYFISYKGGIYFIENNNVYLLSGVEKLPNNYRYTVLYASEEMLYAAWEQQRFFLTGACGFTLIEKKRVDKIQQ